MEAADQDESRPADFAEDEFAAVRSQIELMARQQRTDGVWLRQDGGSAESKEGVPDRDETVHSCAPIFRDFEPRKTTARREFQRGRPRGARLGLELELKVAWERRVVIRSSLRAT
jgi:hypothetical protein